MNQNDDSKPASVATTPKQAGEARDQWWWVERCVWTERRLTRLTAREPADRVWCRLWDKTYAPAHFQSAFDKVWRNGGSAGEDEQIVAHFGRHAEAELQRLHEQLRDGTYQPQPVRRAWIAKPGRQEKRALGMPAVRDRLVPGARRHVWEPIFAADMAEHSYGFRPGRGANGRSLSAIAAAVDRSLRGWHGYFQHSQASTFAGVDG
jgi:RNA-directed DNA polymerase